MILVIYVNPTINQDLFNEVFVFVVAKKQRATTNANPSSWNRGVEIIKLSLGIDSKCTSMLGILSGPIVPFMEIMFCYWMKLATHVCINLREAQQVNVKKIKNSICQLFLCNNTKPVGKLYVQIPSLPQHLIIPKMGGQGKKIYIQTKIL